MSDLREFSQNVDEVTRSLVGLVDCWHGLSSADDEAVNGFGEWSEIFSGSVDEVVYTLVGLAQKVHNLSK